MNEQGDSEKGDQLEVARHEERLRITKDLREEGVVRIRKGVTTDHVAEYLPRTTEDVEMEHVDPEEDDSGEIETLPDGSLSIPVLEEELVVTKRVVVRERIIVRKHTRTEQARVEADLRRERVEIDTDPT
jgi:uncharacterized protein (TIGR02271 family)